MTDTPENLPVSRNVKIGFFHLGSGMADVLATGVWNRIMISDLGFAAGPVSLLLSLRYFLAPLGIWAGRMSDKHRVLGFRRLFWIWLGRLLMVVSTVMLGVSTAQLVGGGDVSPMLWLAIGGSLVTFSLGNALSGSTFLALVYDRAPESQRGRAVGIVWTFLLLGFTLGGVFFGLALPSTEGVDGLTFTAGDLQNLFIMAALIFTGLWFFSLVGEERRYLARATDAPVSGSNEIDDRSFWNDLSLVWRDRSMRFFLFYLVGSMFFAFSQDVILEPFAADVFDMPAQVTNRFAAYWGGTAIVGSLVFLWLSRRFTWMTNTRMSQAGTAIILLTFALLTACAWLEIRALVTPGLILLGLGLGLWNIGTLGLMMDFSPVGSAGTFLGFWTLCVTLARGGGVASGGLSRDVWQQVTGQPHISYGMVFAIGVLGLGLSLWALSRVNVGAFKANLEQERSQNEEVATILAGAMD